jgi:hypothetical protein
MSIYRDRDRIFRDVHTFESIKETPAEALKADAIAEDQYRSMRKAQPVNTPLPRTQTWIAGLPVDVRPTALMDKFPRIANVLAATWGDSKAFGAYMESLLTDKRGNRRGFPVDVVRELGVLAFFEHQEQSRL